MIFGAVGQIASRKRPSFSPLATNVATSELGHSAIDVRSTLVRLEGPTSNTREGGTMSSARGSAEENARGDGHRDPVLEPSPGEDEDGERGRQRFVDRQGGWVLSSLGDGVLTADGDGVVTFINPAAERLTGWSAADAVGEPVDRAFHLLHEDGERAVSTPIASVLRDGSAASIGGRRQLVRRDGTRLRVGGSVTPLRVEDGKVDGVVIVFRDVSSEALEAEVASRAKDDFLAMLGHELRNPLAPIVSALDLIRMHGAGKFERELAVVGRQLSRVTRLVDDLLDVGRMTGGRLLLRREPVDVSEAVLLASERVGPLVEDRGQQLVLETPGVLLVRGDVDRLSQAIGNLIVNAATYT
ncbi:MAG: PAS domain-containing protein, partial [Labilithrix sp.]|nr:PAS domain-containing protein [Labilithrix sp.]